MDKRKIFTAIMAISMLITTFSGCSSNQKQSYGNLGKGDESDRPEVEDIVIDNESDILIEARDVILSMAEVALEQGFLLSDLAEPYKDYSQEKNYSYCNRWIAVDVDMSAINDEQKRVNISLSTVLLARIDAVVESNRVEYKDRSSFISMAASHEIHRNRA